MAKEKQFEEKIKRFLKEQKCWLVKYWGGGHFTTVGVPDILVCAYGQFVAVEVKAEDGEPSELQLHALHEIDKAGGVAILLFPKDYEIFTTMMHRIGAYQKIEPEDLVEYLYFREVRREWEKKRGLNFG